MSERTQLIAAVIATAIMSAGSVFGFGMQPLRSENNEVTLNGQLVRDELTTCLQELKQCWKDCR